MTKKPYIPAAAHGLPGGGSEMMRRYGFKPTSASQRAVNQIPAEQRKPAKPEGSMARLHALPATRKGQG